jgi:hypothetical protein
LRWIVDLSIGSNTVMPTSSHQLIGFVSFASGWMLVWAAAALIPIAIHLLSRKARATTPWAAMEFLQAALRKNARRLQIEQLLLLALRSSIFVLLALALARPLLFWLPASSSLAQSRDPTHTILVLDGSYSMAYEVPPRRRFDLAKDAARKILATSRQGDGYSLLLMAEPTRTIIGDVAFDRDDVQQELDDLQVTHEGGSLVSALEAVERVVQSAVRQHPRLGNHRVCFLTDLGATTWDEVLTSDCRQRVAQLAQQATLQLVDVGNASSANLAVTRLASDNPLPVVNDRVVLEAEIENFGTQYESDKRLTLLLDGTQIDEKMIGIDAGARITTSFAVTCDTPGEHVLELALESDRLAVDNTRWLSLPVQRAIRVLCAEGKQDAGRYVALALAPQTSVAGRIQPERAAENAILERDLTEYDCVWLANIGRFDRDEANLLRSYVRSGGGLVISLGDQVQADNYNQLLGDPESGRVLPARLQELVAESGVRFDPLEYRHPLLAPFRGQQRSGLLTTPVARFIRAEPLDAESSQIALGFTTGDPAIVEESVGQGVCVLLTTAASLHSLDRTAQPPVVWTGLPAWPSFPPLVQQILRVATRGRWQSRNAMVGDLLTSYLPPRVTATSVTIETPDEREERVPVRIDGTLRRWTTATTSTAGVHHVRFGEDLPDQELFAVNVDTRESNLARFDRELLPEAFADTEQIEDIRRSGDGQAGGLPIHRAFLGILLALIVAEAAMAWRLGRHS